MDVAMGDVDFATRFSNLEGELISERKKNFSKLLRSYPTLDEDELKNIRPRTYLESLLYIDMLIYFKKTVNLLKIFKEGNEVFISKILKQKWFFQEILKDMSTKDLVNEFLPCTSFTTRMKLLKKISVIFNESEMDEIFDCVHERYGFHIAKTIIHTCSGNKIEELLSIREIRLQPNQVKAIFDKNPELFVTYLEHYNQLKGNVYYNGNVYKYIARKNIELWLHLKETGKIITHKLGRRIGKKVVDLKKLDVIKNIKTYTEFLRKDVIVRKLQGSFEEVYLQLFPKTKDDMCRVNYCDELFTHYPKKRQWELFSQTFTKVFDQNILDNLLHVSTQYIKLVPSREIIMKWAETQYESDNKNNVLKYFDPNKAIPMIKEKINVTSNIQDRTNLIMILLENCAENNDLKSLETVLKYICRRHRNEEPTFRYGLLSKIQQLFMLTNLNDNHWKYINEQITFLKFRDEFYYDCHFVFLRRYLEYLFKSGKPFKHELVQYVNEIRLENLSFRVNLDNPQFERDVLMQISVILEKDEVTYDNPHERLIIDIINFNREYPAHLIDIRNISKLISCAYSIFDKSVDTLIDPERKVVREILLYNVQYPQKAVKIENAKVLEIFANTKRRFWLQEVVRAMVKKEHRTEFENEVLKFFWNNLVSEEALSRDIFSWYLSKDPQSLLPYLGVILECNLSSWCVDIVSWCLHHQPRTLLPFFNTILEKNLETQSNYFQPADIKMMSHFNFDARLIEVYVKKLDNTAEETPGTFVIDVDFSIKEKAITILSKVMSTDDFIKIVERFLPVKGKVNPLDAETIKISKLQCEVAKSLKRLQEPVKMLPVVLEFSFGDQLQSGLPALYSVFYRSPEKSLQTYINMLLSNRAESVRKHSIFLSCELLSINCVVNILKTGKRDNVSSEKHLFTAALKYFLKNPSEEFLNYVIMNLNSIDKNDEETLYKVVEINILQKYKHIYLESCWTFFENIKEKGIKIVSYLNLLLESLCIRNVLVLLSKEFCIRLITNYFRDGLECLYKMNEFVISCLRYRETEQDENFKMFFETISLMKGKKHYEDNWQIERSFYLFYDMADENLINERKDAARIKFIKQFEQGWTQLFQPMEKFDEYVLLSLVIAKCEASDPFLENYAQNIIVVMEKLVSEYGPLIFYKFQTHLTRSFIFPTDEDRYLFFYNLLKINTSTFTCVMVLDLLQKYFAGKSKEFELVYYEILEILKNVTDPIVVLYYNEHLAQLNA